MQFLKVFQRFPFKGIEKLESEGQHSFYSKHQFLKPSYQEGLLESVYYI